MKEEDKEKAIKAKVVTMAIIDAMSNCSKEERLTVAVNLLYSYIKEDGILEIKDFMRFVTNSLFIKLNKENGKFGFGIVAGSGSNTNAEFTDD